MPGRAPLKGAGPEAPVLLAVARFGPGPGSRREGWGEGLGVDEWPRLLSLARRHGLLPQLRRRLEDAPGICPPRNVQVDLWAHREWIRQRNAGMVAALGEILAVLEGQGIPALPFKGPMLALQAYGDFAAREFADLDLLLRPSDVAAARAALRDLGYRPEHALAPAQEAAMLRARTQYHVLLIHPARAIAVELHWKSDPDHPVEDGTAAWWEARPRVGFGDRQVRAFTPSELLLLLCIHGSKHHWSRLAWLADVAALLGQEPGFDWPWIRARAAELGASRRLALGLDLAAGLLEAPLPADVARWAAHAPAVRRQAERIIAHLCDPGPWMPGPWTRLRLDLAQREGLRSKLRFAWDVVFAPSHEEWVRWPLPRGFFFLYAPLRVARLVGKHVFGSAARD